MCTSLVLHNSHKFWLQSLDKIFLHQSLHKTKEEKDRAVIAQLTSMHTVHCTVRTHLNSVGIPVLPNVWPFAQFYTGVFEHQHSFPIAEFHSYKVAATLLTCVHNWTVASLHKKRCSWYLSKTFTKTNAMFSIQNFSVLDFVVFNFHIQGNYQKVDLQTAHLLRLQSKNGRKNK